jgi:hypothetical protein
MVVSDQTLRSQVQPATGARPANLASALFSSPFVYFVYFKEFGND